MVDLAKGYSRSILGLPRIIVGVDGVFMGNMQESKLSSQ